MSDQQLLEEDSLEVLSYYGQATTSASVNAFDGYVMPTGSAVVWKNFLWRSHSNHCIPIQVWFL
jgi:hypothetical protein